MLEDEKNLLEALWKLNDKVDTLLTDVSGLKTDVADLKTNVAELKTDMVEVKADVAELKTDVAELKTDMVEVKADVAKLKTDMVEVKNDVFVLKSDMAGVKKDITRLEAMETELKALHFDVVELRLTCENDLSRQIRIIAEAHGDMIRCFNRALERKTEMEEYAVRVIYLEGEVRRLKRYWNMDMSA